MFLLCSKDVWRRLYGLLSGDDGAISLAVIHGWMQPLGEVGELAKGVLGCLQPIVGVKCAQGGV